MFSMSESPAAAKRRGFRIIGGFEREIACSGSIAHASIPSRQAPQSTELSFFAICRGQRRREDAGIAGAYRRPKWTSGPYM
jgi:hypothetical protein